MKLKVLAEECRKGTCPAVYFTDSGKLVVQGNLVIAADGLVLGRGEAAVEVTAELVREALRALDR